MQKRRHHVRANPVPGAAAGFLAPLLVTLFAVWLGGFETGTRGTAVSVGVLLLSLVALFGALAGRHPLDPLCLRVAGGRGRLILAALPWVALASMATSRALSQVPRAGLMLLCYGPLLLLLVPALARTASTRAARSCIRVGFGVGLLGVASWALVDWFWRDYERVAMPLGHHNLLALWLVSILPLAVLPRRWHANLEGRSVAESKWSGALEILALSVGLLALLGTRSLAGALGFAAQVVLIAGMSRGSRAPRIRTVGAALIAVTVVAMGAWSRVGQWLSGALDSSTGARWEYLKAGFEGFLERPLLGHGPGASAWTLGRYLDDSRLPPQQFVTDVHSLPADLLFESGLIGVALLSAIGVAWVSARTGEHKIASELEGEAWRKTVDVSLAGLLVTSLFAGYFDVLAVWIWLPVLTGLRLGPLLDRTLDQRSSVSIGAQRILATGLVLLALGAAWGPVRGHLEYQKAVDSGTGEALGRAAAFDPRHPLYAWRLARAQLDAENAVRAAKTAYGVAPLYLGAGALAEQAHAEEALSSLIAACDLAVQDPFAPFLLAASRDFGPYDPGRPTAAQLHALEALGRALVAEPRLLATPELLARPDVRRAVVRQLAQRADLSIGWKAALVDAEAAIDDSPTRVENEVNLVLYFDEVDEVSLSLFSFRRPRLATELVRIRLDSDVAAGIAMPPAAVARAVQGDPWEEGCRLAARR